MWLIDVDSGGFEIEGNWLSRVAEAVLAEKGVKPPAAVSIALCDEAQMVDLNQRYLGRPWVTDVMAFSLSEGEDFVAPPDGISHLGEVIICYLQAIRQAQALGHSVKKEVTLLLIHGLLHLLGWDDGDETKAQEMRQEEARLLRLFPDLGDGV